MDNKAPRTLKRIAKTVKDFEQSYIYSEQEGYLDVPVFHSTGNSKVVKPYSLISTNRYVAKVYYYDHNTHAFIEDTELGTIHLSEMNGYALAFDKYYLAVRAGSSDTEVYYVTNADQDSGGSSGVYVGVLTGTYAGPNDLLLFQSNSASGNIPLTVEVSAVPPDTVIKYWLELDVLKDFFDATYPVEMFYDAPNDLIKYRLKKHATRTRAVLGYYDGLSDTNIDWYDYFILKAGVLTEVLEIGEEGEAVPTYIRWYDQSGGNRVTIQPPVTFDYNHTYTLPTNVPVLNYSFLMSNTSGEWSWSILGLELGNPAIATTPLSAQFKQTITLYQYQFKLGTRFGGINDVVVSLSDIVYIFNGLDVGTSGANNGFIRLRNPATAFYVNIQTGATAADYSLILPTNKPSAAGVVLYASSVVGADVTLDWLSVQAGIQFMDEGVALGAAGTVNEFNVVGSTATLARAGNRVTLTITSSTTGSTGTDLIGGVYGNGLNTTLGNQLQNASQVLPAANVNVFVGPAWTNTGLAFQIPATGFYYLIGKVRTAIGTGATQGYIVSALFKNGVLIPNSESISYQQVAAALNQETVIVEAPKVFCVANELITLQCFWWTGGAPLAIAQVVHDGNGRTNINCLRIQV